MCNFPFLSSQWLPRCHDCPYQIAEFPPFYRRGVEVGRMGRRSCPTRGEPRRQGSGTPGIVVVVMVVMVMVVVVMVVIHN